MEIEKELDGIIFDDFSVIMKPVDIPTLTAIIDGAKRKMTGKKRWVES
jgi:hypothetical protein